MADAGPVTVYRTVAASCLVLGLMGYRGVGPVGLIGSGVQAWYHVSCLREVYGVSDSLVIRRRRDRAGRLAGRFGRGARVVGSLEEFY